MEHEIKAILCPYCGSTQPKGDRCHDCGGYFDALSRKATQISMGPWFIRDDHKPFRPGCSYELIVKQIKAGKITATTVMRGPTTRQFWALARNVPGVSHLLGYCYKCGQHLPAGQVTQCPACQESFVQDIGRNELGLTYASDQEAHLAQEELNRELASLGHSSESTQSPSVSSLLQNRLTHSSPAEKSESQPVSKPSSQPSSANQPNQSQTGPDTVEKQNDIDDETNQVTTHARRLLQFDETEEDRATGDDTWVLPAVTGHEDESKPAKQKKKKTKTDSPSSATSADKNTPPPRQDIDVKSLIVRTPITPKRRSRKNSSISTKVWILMAINMIVLVAMLILVYLYLKN